MAKHARRNFPNPKIADGNVIGPSRCPSRGDANARLAWFDAKLFPAWKVWRAANPGEIVVSRLLRGGYHQ
jgi:hypothetical protein